MNINFLKEKIAYYKLWITILTTIDAGIIAWGYNNLRTLSSLSFIFIGFVILSLTGIFLIINQKTRIFLKKMEDCDNGNIY